MLDHSFYPFVCVRYTHSGAYYIISDFSRLACAKVNRCNRNKTPKSTNKENGQIIVLCARIDMMWSVFIYSIHLCSFYSVDSRSRSLLSIYRFSGFVRSQRTVEIRLAFYNRWCVMNWWYTHVWICVFSRTCVRISSYCFIYSLCFFSPRWCFRFHFPYLIIIACLYG